MTINKFLFLLLFFISCDNSKNNLQIDVKEKQGWLSDSIGCLKYRSKYVENNMKIIKSFIGKDYEEFINNFGTANLIKTRSSNVIYVYWVGCSSLPKVKGVSEYSLTKQLNVETKYLKVEVNKKGIIVNIGLIIP